MLTVGILLAIFQVVKTFRELFPVPNPDGNKRDLGPSRAENYETVEKLF